MDRPTEFICSNGPNASAMLFVVTRISEAYSTPKHYCLFYLSQLFCVSCAGGGGGTGTSSKSSVPTALIVKASINHKLVSFIPHGRLISVLILQHTNSNCKPEYCCPGDGISDEVGSSRSNESLGLAVLRVVVGGSRCSEWFQYQRFIVIHDRSNTYSGILVAQLVASKWSGDAEG